MVRPLRLGVPRIPHSPVGCIHPASSSPEPCSIRSATMTPSRRTAPMLCRQSFSGNVYPIPCRQHTTDEYGVRSTVRISITAMPGTTSYVMVQLFQRRFAMREYRSSVSPKGQITLPLEVRRRWGIKAKDHVTFRVDEEENIVVLVPA